MARNIREPLDWQMCERILLGRSGGRRIANNVVLFAVHSAQSGPGAGPIVCFQVAHHGNTIITFYPDRRVVIQTPVKSVTTKRMLNRFMPSHCQSISQQNYVWYYGSVPFVDGMEVGLVKQCHNCETQGTDDEIAWRPELQCCGPCRDRMIEEGKIV